MIRPSDEVTSLDHGAPHVSCIMIFLDGAEFIDEAIRSVVHQDGFDDWELLLVDDGSTDDSTHIARRWAERDRRIHYLEHDGHENRGMSASRNLGLKHATGVYVAFLDCDDVWLPRKLAVQVGLLDDRPDIDACYGPAQWWYSWTGERADVVRNYLGPVGVEPGTVLRPPELIRLYRRTEGAVVPAICSVLVRREAIEAVGGFEDSFRGSFEDQVFYAKMGLHMTVLVTGECLDRYRQHPKSACARGIQDKTYHPDILNPTEERYLEWLEGYLEDLGMHDDETYHDVQHTLAVYRRRSVRSLVTNVRWRRSVLARAKLRVRRLVPSPLYERIKRTIRGNGRMALHRLRRVEPVNRTVLDTRGTPIEDALVARFLDAHRSAITGNVLGVGPAARAHPFGGPGVDRFDTIPTSAIDAGVVEPSLEPPPDGEACAPHELHDCVIAVSVLQSVRDPANALRQLHDRLEPGGTLLLTVPALVQRQELDRAPARWGFAADTLRDLAGSIFGPDTIEVASEGNALLAVAVVHGLPAEQFSDDELDHRDRHIPILLTLSARRVDS